MLNSNRFIHISPAWSLFAALAAASGVLAPALLAGPPAWAAAGPAMGTDWIMNGGPGMPPPGATWVNQYAAVQAAGYTGRAPQFQLCTDGGENNSPCGAGLTPAYEDYNALKAALKAGLTGHALYDPEGWSYTPADQYANMSYWVCQAAKTAGKYHVRLIEAPVTVTAKKTAVEVRAAKCGAWAVELQDQYATSKPRRYQQIITAAARAIRKASKRIVIIAGIATDAGGYPTTARLMWASWNRVRRLVAGFWLNAAPWTVHANGTPATGCAPTGCPAVAASFLAMTARAS